MAYTMTTKLEEKNLKYYDPTQPPFSIHGVLTPDVTEDYYHRMPQSVAKTVSDGVLHLYANTAGGRIRFVTDSPYVAVKAYLPSVLTMAHMAQTGIAGFGVYTREDGKWDFAGIINPQNKKTYEVVVRFRTQKMREVMIYMPLYNNVNRVFVGVDSTANLLAAPAYTTIDPVVFYGSSITQGGCASKPGSDYQACLSRVLDFEYVNLGFSGNAKGESTMAEYIASLKMSAFVMDYDYNAPNPAHLQKTHESFFQTIRKAHPDLPVLMVSKPDAHRDSDNRARFEVIRETYEKAKQSGDLNVRLLDGADFFTGAEYNDPTVDGVHPTDYGFYLMAKGMEATIRQMLNRK